METATRVFYFLLVMSMALGATLRPTYNWDLFGYMGAALKLNNDDAAQIHAQVYMQAKSVIPNDKYRELTSSPYRADMQLDANHFAQQLPFYNVRPLFVVLVAAIHKAGLNLVYAVYVVPALSYLAITVLLFIWLNRHVHTAYATLFSALLAISPPLLAVSRSGTPDALSAAILFGALYMLLEKRRLLYFGALLVLSLFARSDNIIFAFLLSTYLVIFGRGRWALSLPQFTALAVACGVSYFAIDLFAGYYGWATVFYHTFVAFMSTPAQQSIHITLRDYLGAFKEGLHTILDNYFIFFAFLGVITYSLTKTNSKDSLNAPYSHILVVIAATIGLRYVLFPLLLDRFVIFFYLAVATILIIKSAEYAQMHKPATSAVNAMRV